MASLMFMMSITCGMSVNCANTQLYSESAFHNVKISTFKLKRKRHKCLQEHIIGSSKILTYFADILPSSVHKNTHTHTQPLQMVLPPRDALRVLLNRLYTAQWKVNSTSKLIHLTCNHSGRFKQNGLYEHAAIFRLHVREKPASVSCHTDSCANCVQKSCFMVCTQKVALCSPHPPPYLTYLRFHQIPTCSQDIRRWSLVYVSVVWQDSIVHSVPKAR